MQRMKFPVVSSKSTKIILLCLISFAINFAQLLAGGKADEGEANIKGV